MSVTPAPIAAGDLRISEVQRNPSVVPDSNGEYIEVVNVGAAPVALRFQMAGDDVVCRDIAEDEESSP